MAVTKIWAIHDSASRAVDYCTNPSKTKLSDLEQVLLYAADKDKIYNGQELEIGAQQCFNTFHRVYNNLLKLDYGNIAFYL